MNSVVWAYFIPYYICLIRTNHETLRWTIGEEQWIIEWSCREGSGLGRRRRERCLRRRCQRLGRRRALVRILSRTSRFAPRGPTFLFSAISGWRRATAPRLPEHPIMPSSQSYRLEIGLLGHIYWAFHRSGTRLRRRLGEQRPTPCFWQPSESYLCRPPSFGSSLPSSP